MKRRLAQTIVKARYGLLAVLLILAVVSVFTISKTRINYDLNRYLSDSTMTKRALTVMEAEFGSSEQLRLMFADQTDESMAAKADAVNTLPEVLLAAYDPETGIREADGHTYHLITVALNDCDTADLVKRLRAMFPDEDPYYVGGTAAALVDTQNQIGEEMFTVMLIAVAIVLLVLLLTSHAWPTADDARPCMSKSIPTLAFENIDCNA